MTDTEPIAPPERPLLRPVEAREVEFEGERMVGVRDPAWPPDRMVVLSHGAVALISLFDGERDREAIQAAFRQQHGEAVPDEILETVISQLDEAMLLDSARYARDLHDRREAFRVLPMRPMTMGDTCFPAEAVAAGEQLDGFYTLPQGPGRLPAPGEGGAVQGVIAPHIDYQRGDALYARCYARIAEAASLPELFVLLGTDHRGEVDAPFSLTAVDFETPFGRLQTDAALVEELTRTDATLRDGELAHEAEHSVEFQAVMLHHALGERAAGVRILPVLCGLLTDREGNETAERTAQIEAFIEQLRALRQRRSTCLVAGADLAHLGPAFGTPPLDETARQSLEHRDGRTLETLAAGDAEGFRRDVAADGNQRNICGLSAIYTLLRVLEPPSGTVLGYRQCPVPGDETDGSRVTITAVSYP